MFANVISGNGGAGLRLSACPDAVTGNRIGTQADCTGSVPNGGAGVVIPPPAARSAARRPTTRTRSRATRGRASPSRPRARSCSATRSTATAPRACARRAPLLACSCNLITANGGLGIDDDLAGVSPGPPRSPASSARADAACHRSLAAATSGQYDLEFFANVQCDASGFGEGATPLGIKSVLTASPGTVALDLVVAADAPAGTVVTATQTRAGQTSEFSACRRP